MQLVKHPGTLPVTLGTYSAVQDMLLVLVHACTDI